IDSSCEGGDRLILSRQSAATSCGQASMNRLTVATKPKTSFFIWHRSCSFGELVLLRTRATSTDAPFRPGARSGVSRVRPGRQHQPSHGRKIAKENDLRTSARTVKAASREGDQLSRTGEPAREDSDFQACD